MKTQKNGDGIKTVSADYKIFRLFLVFGLVVADKGSLARGTNYFFGITGLVEVYLFAAGRTHSAEKFRLVVITAAVAIAIIIVATAIAVTIVIAIAVVDIVYDLLNLAEVLIDFFDVIVAGIKVLVDSVDLVSDLADNVNELGNDLVFGLCRIKIKSVKQTLKVCALFNNAHGFVSFLKFRI